MKEHTTICGIDAIKEGNDYVISCPICNSDIEKTNKCRAKKQDNSLVWYCFGCQIGGKMPLYFLYADGHDPANASKSEWKEAYKKAGIESTLKHSEMKSYDVNSRLSKEEKALFFGKKLEESREMPSPVWIEKAMEFLADAEKELQTSQDGQDFIRKRGITLTTASHFHIGWSPQFHIAETWGTEQVSIIKGLVLPTFTLDGVPCFIGIRSADWKQGDKYSKFSAIEGSKRQFFFSDNGLDGTEYKPILLFESVLDAILVYQECEGIVTTVAASGVSAPCLQDISILQRAPLVIYCADADKAGSEAGVKWYGYSLQYQFKKFDVLYMPKGKDAGEAFKAGVNILQWCERLIAKFLPSFFSEAEPDIDQTKEAVHSVPSETFIDDSEQQGEASSSVYPMKWRNVWTLRLDDADSMDALRQAGNPVKEDCSIPRLDAFCEGYADKCLQCHCYTRHCKEYCLLYGVLFGSEERRQSLVYLWEWQKEHGRVLLPSDNDQIERAKKSIEIEEELEETSERKADVYRCLSDADELILQSEVAEYHIKPCKKFFDDISLQTFFRDGKRKYEGKTLQDSFIKRTVLAPFKSYHCEVASIPI